MRRMLEPCGMEKWLAKKRPLLTKETAAKRYRWAKEYSKWTVPEWSNVQFSDECSVECGASHVRKYVFRFAGQQFDRDKVTNYNKSKDISVMVWAAIATAGLSDLMMMRRDPSAENQDFTTRSYLQVSRDDLIPIILETDIYQQDGARIHTSKAANAWFKRNSTKLLGDWPPYSPDLNPIEHLWPLLKEKLYELYSDIELWRGSEAQVPERMEDALVHAWGQIRDQVAYNSVSSMPERIQACIRAKGWYTQY
jgi:hypothetical protein